MTFALLHKNAFLALADAIEVISLSKINFLELILILNTKLPVLKPCLKKKRGNN